MKDSVSDVLIGVAIAIAGLSIIALVGGAIASTASREPCRAAVALTRTLADTLRVERAGCHTIRETTE